MLTLSVEKRKTLGKGNRTLSTEVIPAVYYGHKEASTPISISKIAFKKVLKEAGEASVIILKDGEKELEALIHEIDFDPIRGDIRHADFYVIEKGKKVQVAVPIHFEGVAGAVKNLGGILIKVLHEIEVEAMPKDLPHSIEVNVEGLDTFESQIHVSDIKFPAGVVAITGMEEVVAAISQPREEKEEEAAPVDLAAIELSVEKGKKEEEGAEGEAAESEKK